MLRKNHTGLAALKLGIQFNSLEALLAHCRRRIYPANGVIFEAGDQRGSLAAVSSGD